MDEGGGWNQAFVRFYLRFWSPIMMIMTFRKSTNSLCTTLLILNYIYLVCHVLYSSCVEFIQMGCCLLCRWLENREFQKKYFELDRYNFPLLFSIIKWLSSCVYAILGGTWWGYWWKLWVNQFRGWWTDSKISPISPWSYFVG